MSVTAARIAAMHVRAFYPGGVEGSFAAEDGISASALVVASRLQKTVAPGSDGTHRGASPGY